MVKPPRVMIILPFAIVTLLTVRITDVKPVIELLLMMLDPMIVEATPNAKKPLG